MAYVYRDTMRGIKRRQPSFRGVSKEAKKELNSLIILVAWEIWKHRNDCIVNNATPSTAAVLDAVARESLLLCTAGARALHELLARVFLCEALCCTSPMEIKMKGIFKGLKIISQIFALQKQHEMEIGCPTDVRHVSHIGVGTSDSCPSWRIGRVVSRLHGLFCAVKEDILGISRQVSPSISSFCPLMRSFFNFDKPPRTTLPTEICKDNSGQEAAACCHDIPRGPKNPRRKKTARASSASSFLSRSRSSSFVTACGDFSELRGGLRVA
uniref:CRIB domain-containing protein n=1 Tax=Oryza meridionalis TaxID=40149 RepID=A0A0E0E5D9_9ORYZ